MVDLQCCVSFRCSRVTQLYIHLCGILVPLQRTEPAPPALEAQSLKYCTTKEVSIYILVFPLNSMYLQLKSQISKLKRLKTHKFEILKFSWEKKTFKRHWNGLKWQIILDFVFTSCLCRLPTLFFWNFCLCFFSGLKTAENQPILLQGPCE